MKLCSYLSQTHRFQSTSSAISRSHLTNDEIRAYLLRIFANEYINRPLEHDCKLNFFILWKKIIKNKNVLIGEHVHLLLYYILETAFKSNYNVELCSFPPPPQFQYGSFSYDIKLNLDWQPSRDDFRYVSIQAYKLCDHDLRFRYLDITQSVAEEMFAYD
ncbi:unnamed protein product [Rotaria sp. Silwood2]|nr:unnamed protein product [Rotaria sp. Silwood2]